MEQNKETFREEKLKLVVEKDQQISGLRKENSYYQDMIKELRKTNN